MTDQDISLNNKIKALKDSIEQMGSVLVAFSGGVDSTYLAVVASEVLGKSSLAVTATSAAYATRELEEARSLASKWNFRHMVVESDELAIPGFSDNNADRCYHCKKGLFGDLLKIAEAEGLCFVLDGTNSDDGSDYRPGRRAAAELGIVSPLAENGFTKNDIRAASRQLGLETATKPAYACLASRFPYGDMITEQKLGQVEAIENYLHSLGFKIFRARHHGQIVRLELGNDEMRQLMSDNTRHNITQFAKEQGFTYVTIDIEGYRTGSMNDVLDSATRKSGSL